jgi:hypothetical protein
MVTNDKGAMDLVPLMKYEPGLTKAKVGRNTTATKTAKITTLQTLGFLSFLSSRVSWARMVSVAGMHPYCKHAQKLSTYGPS